MEDYRKTKEFRNGGKVFHEPYSEERLLTLKKLVENLKSQGRKKRFSISVDGEMIVHHTHEPERFDDYLDYIEPHTEQVEVRMYFGESPNANRYIFHLQEKSLSGIGSVGKPENVNDLIAEALEKQSIESELKTLRKKYRKAKKRLREAEEQLSEKGGDLKDLLSQGMQLYGAFNGKTPSQPIQGLPLSEEVEIEKELSEADQFYHELKAQLGESKLTEALKTWAIFAQHPELRSEFQSIVSQKTQHNE